MERSGADRLATLLIPRHLPTTRCHHAESITTDWLTDDSRRLLRVPYRRHL